MTRADAGPLAAAQGILRDGGETQLQACGIRGRGLCGTWPAQRRGAYYSTVGSSHRSTAQLQRDPRSPSGGAALQLCCALPDVISLCRYQMQSHCCPAQQKRQKLQSPEGSSSAELSQAVLISEDAEASEAAFPKATATPRHHSIGWE